MKEENLQHIKDIVSAIDVNGDKQVLLHGKAFVENFSDPYLDRPGNKMLFEIIHKLIYEIFYTKTKRIDSSASITREEIVQSVNKLSDANTSTERFEEGWYVEDIDGLGNIMAVKGSMKRRVQPGEFLTDTGSHQRIEKGKHIRLFMAREMKDFSSIFYHVFGETAGEENSSEVVRIYFNMSFEGNCLLIRLLGGSLNSYAVPFIFKCLYHPFLYNRADTAVLYFDKKYSAIVFAILKNIYPQIKEHARDDIPLLTLKLGKGISFAETPARLSESFGTHWSKIIAAGMMNAYEAALPKEKWMDEVLKHIQVNHGYTDLEKLYLNPGSAYPYAFPLYE